MNVTRPLSVVSLFAGAGGLDLGLERAGWEVVAATDFDRASMSTLRTSKDLAIPVTGRLGVTHMSNTRLIEADVRELTASDLRPTRARATWRPDLLAGGPPCQPWSSAGHQRGLEDPRGQLIGHMLRLIYELKPRYVLFENVRGLVTAVGPNGRSGEVLRSIQADLEDIGYASKIATLNAADYGAAQRRVRLVLLASSDHHLPPWPAPTHARYSDASSGTKPWVSMRSLLAKLPAPDEVEVVRPSGVRAAELECLEPGKGLRTGGKVESNRPSGHWGYRQDSFVADTDLPARTVRAATTPDWIRDGEGRLRRLTWRECAALQGFPNDWAFMGTAAAKFRQIGNAVQAEMATALGDTLRAELARGRASKPPVSPPWPDALEARVRYTLAEHRVNAGHRTRVRPQV
ncbi:DNA cytosine methyltransferase [Jatrophihabitans telluris]|uniref:DNA cytosine methyltransferase n=1 Tax=Jatrophihabitans telluris TaxID=2038343 RepID=UPI003D320D54